MKWFKHGQNFLYCLTLDFEVYVAICSFVLSWKCMCIQLYPTNSNAQQYMIWFDLIWFDLKTTQHGNSLRITGPVYWRSTDQRWITITTGKQCGALMFVLLVAWKISWTGLLVIWDVMTVIWRQCNDFYWYHINWVFPIYLPYVSQCRRRAPFCSLTHKTSYPQISRNFEAISFRSRFVRSDKSKTETCGIDKSRELWQPSW